MIHKILTLKTPYLQVNAPKNHILFYLLMLLLHQIIFHAAKGIFKLERIYKLITTIDDKVRDEKLNYDFCRETAKISAL